MNSGSTIAANIKGVSTREELHERLAAAFSFPDYYGKNWDAFWDCITTLQPMPQMIRITGVKQLGEVLPQEAEHLKRCLRDFQTETDLKSITLVLE